MKRITPSVEEFTQSIVDSLKDQGMTCEEIMAEFKRIDEDTPPELLKLLEILRID